MLKTRVIPILLLQNGGLIKGEKFKKHKYVGDPINAVRIFNEKEVDELVFLDIGATLQNKTPDYSLIKDIASEAFMPIAYGGGINSPNHVECLFKSGIEKVVINTHFSLKPNFIREISDIAGSQSVVVSIDVKKSLFGNYEVYSHCGTRKTGYNPIDYALKAQDLGAGELVITSIDREGSGKGFDLALIQQVADAVDIPVIAQGGASNLNDLKIVICDTHASAVAAGTLFTFHGKHKAVLITYPERNILENLFHD
ncbi:imidazole glycerol phosphate synthase subunit HisF [Xenorhabdus nematophila]|uniref:AglZ/HisF2 family acetamidino modification protein n=1 Tax=Xenorhabdus nematophila TaxID=628 RepID=UPI0003275DAD|nr:AglZ/HisF2 family acetamidino modification protein [Xenorhabdus nematophila]CEF33699.1 putative imidazole glycerol phosphate synthase subunit hisF2 [Xenorhabdus nematophila str. Websteri]AYA41578.1 imidazole glycerol phosphate synthase subunit HisF [Xenorhabdus nematophila]KHD27993.1 imidazole glycerol phosphate synthase [Xenorhabdus nematophila]MBA0020317.1 imidazole glycerol phosphate synthase subunit HisF [Xenorhabdus nematophila]MCB4426080.1 imidazole glycerol phosphate synthase subunit